MTAQILPLPRLAERLARLAAPHADCLVETMVNRGARLGGIAPGVETRTGGPLMAFGPRFCGYLAEAFGRPMPAPPKAIRAVLVVTPNACAWVTLDELAQAGHQAAVRPYFHAPTCSFRGLEPRDEP